MNPEAVTEQHEHAVENGVIRHLSVSQVKSFLTCERLWFQNKVEHLPIPTKKSQQIGIDGHAQLEHYVMTGQDALGPIAAAGKHLIPEPGPGVLAEVGLPGLTAAGVPFEGYIDLLNFRDIGRIRVTDYKFTASIEKYAARPEDLATTAHEHGIQMLGYERGLFLAKWYPAAEFFDLEHIYFQTKGEKRAESRVITVPAGSFDSEWERVERAAERMKELAKATDLGAAKPNWLACEKYGGCHFRARCLTYQQRKGTKSMGILDRLTATASATPIPAPAPAAPPPPPPPPAPVVTATPAPTAVELKPVLGGPSVYVEPKEALAEKKFAEETEKPKAKRTKKEAEPVAAAPAPAASPAADRMRLFVDAIPNGPFEDLRIYLTETKARIEKDFGLGDLRVAPSDSPLGFGKWKGFLAATIRANPPKAGTYVVMQGGSELVQVLVETLEPFCGAGDFVRGVGVR